MTRSNFLIKLVRIGLLALLSVISVLLAGKITFDKCSACPASGYCRGETDCEKYNQGRT